MVKITFPEALYELVFKEHFSFMLKQESFGFISMSKSNQSISHVDLSA